MLHPPSPHVPRTLYLAELATPKDVRRETTGSNHHGQINEGKLLTCSLSKSRVQEISIGCEEGRAFIVRAGEFPDDRFEGKICGVTGAEHKPSKLVLTTSWNKVMIAR